MCHVESPEEGPMVTEAQNKRFLDGLLDACPQSEISAHKRGRNSSKPVEEPIIISDETKILFKHIHLASPGTCLNSPLFQISKEDDQFYKEVERRLRESL